MRNLACILNQLSTLARQQRQLMRTLHRAFCGKKLFPRKRKSCLIMPANPDEYCHPALRHPMPRLHRSRNSAVAKASVPSVLSVLSVLSVPSVFSVFSVLSVLSV